VAGDSPAMLRTATILLVTLAVLLLVVRPVTKKLTVSLLAPPPEGKLAAQPMLAVKEPAELPVIALEIEQQRAQQLFEEVAGRLKDQPAQGSRLLQSWIHSE
jgi:flagellar biosynthesis/type III secretory pathway M-ring protein FliF/YscJ